MFLENNTVPNKEKKNEKKNSILLGKSVRIVVKY